MKRDIGIDGSFREVTLVRRGESATLSFGGRSYDCTLRELGGGEFRLSIDGRTHRLWIAVHKGVVYVHAWGRAWALDVADPVERAQRVASGGEDIARAPMPGIVVALLVAEGDRVHKGQPLLVIESMKMQTEIVARRDGRVERMFVAPGHTFDRDARLVALAAEE